MKILIDIPKDRYNTIKNKNQIEELNMTEWAIAEGQVLPKDCEILTKEAYSDLCMRAAGIEREEK